MKESSDSNCSSRFKGVVAHHNGHWGAQIYANHRRVWLGTFKSEISAAMAYDSAAIKLRRGDPRRNFPPTTATILEPKFQSHFTAAAVLDMIRDGSYSAKFAEFLQCQQGGGVDIIDGDADIFSCTLLFNKDLTPSDVGRLNRLVIPKRHAVKHFPSRDNERVDRQVQLEFYDREMCVWKFRYCYWKSSQSFVFTRGWNRFVKEKGLRANDTVAFYMYESRTKRQFGKSFLVIDVVAKDDDDDDDDDDGKNTQEDEEGSPSSEARGFKLFGVQID